jgi:NAD(P)-dependent dehydrogenase (short-subunit alcohol dehydrogenase family)
MADKVDLSGKVIIVTGGNSGIGFVAAKDFASRGATVVVVCRHPERGQQAVESLKTETGNNNIKLYLADLNLLADTARVADQLAADFPVVDVLCNNAGGANNKRQVSEEGFERTFVTNHLSGFVLTQKLLPALLNAVETSATEKNAANKGAARIVFTSSLGHTHSPLDFSDLGLENGYSTLKAYGRSKLMNLLTAKEVHRRYGDQGIVASSFHPGAVRTPIWSKGGVLARILGTVMSPFMVNANQGADTMIWLASSNDDASAAADGNYFFKRKLKHTADFATDAAAKELWEVSQELVNPYL